MTIDESHRASEQGSPWSLLRSGGPDANRGEPPWLGLIQAFQAMDPTARIEFRTSVLTALDQVKNRRIGNPFAEELLLAVDQLFITPQERGLLAAVLETLVDSLDRGRVRTRALQALLGLGSTVRDRDWIGEIDWSDEISVSVALLGSASTGLGQIHALLGSLPDGNKIDTFAVALADLLPYFSETSDRVELLELLRALRARSNSTDVKRCLNVATYLGITTDDPLRSIRQHLYGAGVADKAETVGTF